MSERTSVREYMMEFDQSLFDYTYESVYDRVIGVLGMNGFDPVCWMLHRELADQTKRPGLETSARPGQET